MAQVEKVRRGVLQVFPGQIPPLGVGPALKHQAALLLPAGQGKLPEQFKKQSFQGVFLGIDPVEEIGPGAYLPRRQEKPGPGIPAAGHAGAGFLIQFRPGGALLDLLFHPGKEGGQFRQIVHKSGQIPFCPAEEVRQRVRMFGRRAPHRRQEIPQPPGEDKASSPRRFADPDCLQPLEEVPGDIRPLGRKGQGVLPDHPAAERRHRGEEKFLRHGGVAAVRKNSKEPCRLEPHRRHRPVFHVFQPEVVPGGRQPGHLPQPEGRHAHIPARLGRGGFQPFQAFRPRDQIKPGQAQFRHPASRRHQADPGAGAPLFHHAAEGRLVFRRDLLGAVQQEGKSVLPLPRQHPPQLFHRPGRVGRPGQIPGAEFPQQPVGMRVEGFQRQVEGDLMPLFQQLFQGAQQDTGFAAARFPLQAKGPDALIQNKFHPGNALGRVFQVLRSGPGLVRNQTGILREGTLVLRLPPGFHSPGEGFGPDVLTPGQLLHLFQSLQKVPEGGKAVLSLLLAAAEGQLLRHKGGEGFPHVGRHAGQALFQSQTHAVGGLAFRRLPRQRPEQRRRQGVEIVGGREGPQIGTAGFRQAGGAGALAPDCLRQGIHVPVQPAQTGRPESRRAADMAVALQQLVGGEGVRILPVEADRRAEINDPDARHAVGGVLPRHDPEIARLDVTVQVGDAVVVDPLQGKGGLPDGFQHPQQVDPHRHGALRVVVRPGTAACQPAVPVLGQRPARHGVHADGRLVPLPCHRGEKDKVVVAEGMALLIPPDGQFPGDFLLPPGSLGAFKLFFDDDPSLQQGGVNLTVALPLQAPCLVLDFLRRFSHGSFPPSPVPVRTSRPCRGFFRFLLCRGACFVRFVYF